MTIQRLSDVVAAQIAAGEVVERPASVVKELVENALDAGARSIRVEVEGGGRQLIRITDDGGGIPADEIETAFVRHATSKLRTIDDLDTLQTLGFRGEALASIAAVAHVTMQSRTAEDSAASRVKIEGGVMAERGAAGAPVGTSVAVERLFYNTPARLKFMKSDATERRHIDTLIARYAMAYPNVRFSLAQDGRITFATSGNGSLADVLVEALGLEIMRDMIEVVPLPPARPDLPDIQVYGYASAPRLNRNTRAHITLFVNGRSIQDASLTHAVAQAYHTLMPGDRYPVAVVLIVLDPADVDVNVHPTKAEVRFRSPDAVFSAVQRAVRRAVSAGTSALPTSGGVETPSGPESAPWRDLDMPAPAQAAPPPPSVSRQLDLDMPAFDPGRYAPQVRPNTSAYTPPPAQPRAEESGADASGTEKSTPEPDPLERMMAAPPASSRPNLPPLRVIGQLAATYILAEGPVGLYMIDQHAAHERILYEQFMAEKRRQPQVAQRTLDGITVHLAPATARLVEEHAEALSAAGFEIEAFGGNNFRVRAVPAALATVHDPGGAVEAILGDLERGLEPGESTVEAQIVLHICKAAAVKAGQILSHPEMTSLIRQLTYCESPRTCPHGRPTIIHISAAQLAKDFGRT